MSHAKGTTGSTEDNGPFATVAVDVFPTPGQVEMRIRALTPGKICTLTLDRITRQEVARLLMPAITEAIRRGDI